MLSVIQSVTNSSWLKFEVTFSQPIPCGALYWVLSQRSGSFVGSTSLRQVEIDTCSNTRSIHRMWFNTFCFVASLFQRHYNDTTFLLVSINVNTHAVLATFSNVLFV